MKRIVILFCTLVLLFCLNTAFASENARWCYYTEPEGVEIYSLSEFSLDLAPDGLAGMYAVMSDANNESYVHIFRMPNGRALVSVACYSAPGHGTVQDLYDNWDALAAGLGTDAKSINRDISCASLQNRYGYDALVIQTEMVPLSDPTLTLTMEGTVFYDGDDMFESWVVYPVESNFQNLSLLQSDLSALRQLQSTFRFYGEGGEEESAEVPEAAKDDDTFSDYFSDFAAQTFGDGEDASAPDDVFAQFDNASPAADNAENPAFTSEIMQKNAWRYTDTENNFAIWLPEGAVVLHASSTDEEFAAERARWEEAYEGGGEAFDKFCLHIDETGFTLVSCPAQLCAFQLSCTEAGVYADYTLEDYLALEDGLVQVFEEDFGYTYALIEGGKREISGIEHASMGFSTEAGGDRRCMVLVYAVTDSNGMLREIDTFTVNDADKLIDPNMAYFLEDIVYTVEYTGIE